MSQPTQDIAITAHPAKEPQVCSFAVDRPLHAGRVVRCRSLEEAVGSPLLEELFAVADLSEALVSGSVLTLTSAGDVDWQQLGPRIAAAIRGAVGSEQPAVIGRAVELTPEEADIRDTVTWILTERINPQIASHGGFVEVHDVQGSTVFMVMGGGCQGCASAKATLRGGVEKALRQAVPEIGDIVDVTDHASGENPYYS
jgi:Fe-S cluster biogenesis protein NfuA